MQNETEDIKKEKQVLVFLHYFGGSRESWNWVIKKLKKEYNCISINIPGFGGEHALPETSIKSLANHIRQKITKLGIVKYHLIGHSMGAKIAVQMAADDKEDLVKQLILVAPSPPGAEPTEEKEQKRMLKHPDSAEAKKTIKNITKLPLSDEQQKLALKDNIRTDQTVWNWWLKEGMKAPVETELQNLILPITILNSESDSVITPKIIEERVLKLFPKAKHFTTESCGHLIPFENPDWVAEQIKIAVDR